MHSNTGPIPNPITITISNPVLNGRTMSKRERGWGEYELTNKSICYETEVDTLSLSKASTALLPETKAPSNVAEVK